VYIGNSLGTLFTNIAHIRDTAMKKRWPSPQFHPHNRYTADADSSPFLLYYRVNVVIDGFGRLTHGMNTPKGLYLLALSTRVHMKAHLSLFVDTSGTLIDKTIVPITAINACYTSVYLTLSAYLQNPTAGTHKD